jgi:hypothetical protein
VPAFFHHPQASIARDPLEVLYSEYPSYARHLRHGSRKTFVVVSDADAGGERYRSADTFVTEFDALDPFLLAGWRMASIHAFSLCPAAVSVGSVYADLVSQRGRFSGDLCSSDWDALLWDLARDLSSDLGPIPCTFELPSSIQPIDLMKVNMRLESPGEPEELVRYVGSASNCSPTAGGWYYANLTGLTRLETCPATCERIQRLEVGAKLTIYSGCPTEVAPNE